MALPVERTIGLRHQRACTAAHTGFARLQAARHLTAGDPLERHQDSVHRGLGDFVPIQARLAAGAHREGLRRPYRAGIHLSFGLQHGHAPLALALDDRPVQRRGAAVANDAGVHDQAAHLPPHRLGDRTLQERRDHDIGPPQRDRLLRDSVGDVELDRDLVVARRELDVQPLRQAVIAAGQQQDPHRSAPPRDDPGRQHHHRHADQHEAAARRIEVLQQARPRIADVQAAQQQVERHHQRCP